MDYKKMYEEVLEKICQKDIDEFDNIVEQDRPEFADKLIPNENAPYHCVFSQKLDDSVATEKDYKDFCRYIYTYIGLDFNEIIGVDKFANFKKQNA